MGLDLQIIRIDPTTRVVSLEFPNPPRFVEGIFMLVQQLVLELLQEPGTQALDPSAGAGLKRFLGTAPPKDQDLANIQMDMSVVFGQVEERIRNRQVNLNLTSEERLASIQLESLTLDRDAQAWVVILLITTEAGTSTRVDVSEVVFGATGIRTRG